MTACHRRVLGTSCALALALVSALCPHAEASWTNRADLIYGTAHTLDQGELEVGIFSPLQYGVSDSVQLALHPILLLVLTPHLSARWRVSKSRRVTGSIDVGATWSFLDRVNREGLRVVDDGACHGCGFPGTLQLTGTVSVEVTKGLMLSAGAGPALDFLNLRPELFLLELHASALYLINADNLLMLHGATNIHPWAGSSATSRSSLQLMYAHAWGAVHLGVGLAMGKFALIVDEGTVRSLPGRGGVTVEHRGNIKQWPVYPVVDVWIRL
ncbi:MAG: hypothetical protein R3F39_21190 [Myxococcota bacterium]